MRRILVEVIILFLIVIAGATLQERYVKHIVNDVNNKNSIEYCPNCGQKLNQ